MVPYKRFILKELEYVTIFKIITLTIKHKQLNARPRVSNVIAPPPMSVGSKVFTSHGPPKHINISKVFAPKALLMVIDPIPVTKMIYFNHLRLLTIT